MQIKLNGQSTSFPSNISLAQLLETLELTGKRFAVLLNHTIISRSLCEATALKEDDSVEIVHAIGGG